MDNNERISILLVEDNPDDVDLTRRAFQRAGLTQPIDVVEDGVEALDYLFAREAYAHRAQAPLPGLVLLDLKLPRLDGHEVLRQIRANARTRFLPVVILTSSDEEKDMVESYSHGCNSYVRKPVDFERFSRAIRDLSVYWLRLNERVQSPAEKD